MILLGSIDKVGGKRSIEAWRVDIMLVIAIASCVVGSSMSLSPLEAKSLQEVPSPRATLYAIRTSDLMF